MLSRVITPLRRQKPRIGIILSVFFLIPFPKQCLQEVLNLIHVGGRREPYRSLRRLTLVDSPILNSEHATARHTWRPVLHAVLGQPDEELATVDEVMIPIEILVAKSVAHSLCSS